MFRHQDATFREPKYKISTSTDISIWEVKCQILRYLKYQSFKLYSMVRVKLHRFRYHGCGYNDWATGRYGFESRYRQDIFLFFILILVYVFLLLFMYSYCCLCILIVRPCILIIVYVYLLLSTYS